MLCSDDRAAGPEGAKDVGPPKFVTQLQSRIEISEGQSAHFEARLTPTEDPNMKVCQGSAVLKSLFDFVYFPRLSGSRMELPSLLETGGAPSMTLASSFSTSSTATLLTLALMNAVPPTSWAKTQHLEVSPVQRSLA